MILQYFGELVYIFLVKQNDVHSDISNIYCGSPANISICYIDSICYSFMTSCTNAYNYIGREQKEANPVEVELVVVHLYIWMYWLYSITIVHIFRSWVR